MTGFGRFNQQPGAHVAERAGTPSLLVTVHHDDPRTREQFIDQTLSALIPTVEGGPAGYDVSGVPGFDIKRPPDKKTLDGAIVLSLNKFFAKHTVVVKTEDGYDFLFQDYPLGHVYYTAKELLEEGYGLTDRVDRSLEQQDYVRSYGVVKQRQALAYSGLMVTKRALLEERLRNPPGNMFTRLKEQKAVSAALRSYPPVNLPRMAES